jgi:hypothetical protein
MGYVESMPGSNPTPISAQNGAAPLRGQALVNEVLVSRAAVDNWARFSDGPRDLVSARGRLLDAIRDEGVLSTKPPAWMTSARPGVACYIHLAACSLTMTSTPRAGRRWLATNCIAPKRRPGRRNERIGATVRAGGLNVDELARAAALPSPELAKQCRLSQHALDRFSQRTGIEDQTTASTDLLQAIADNGQILRQPPAWANATRANEPVLEVIFGDDTLALPITGDASAENSFVLTTCLSQRWAEADLASLAVDELVIAGDVLVAWQAQQPTAKTVNDLRDTLAKRQATFDPPPGCPAQGAWWLLDTTTALQLRPISSTQGRAERWLAEQLISVEQHR